jgi:TolB-like protein/class 3 adenylate cyclase/Flp pilus assembly protein TadD
MPQQGRRRLAAIMFTDIVGYSRVMQEDEARGRLLRERHKQVFEQCNARFDGRIVQYFGDGTLSVFDSAVSAVECAVCMQKSLKTYPQVPLRIGIHLGDIHYDETEVYGHGVNVAARIEPVCNPGGIFISEKVYDEIQNHPWLNASAIGVFSFKNIDQDLSLFAVDAKDVTFPNAHDIENVARIAKREEYSTTGKQSAAIQRFLKDKKSARRRQFGKLAAVALVALLAIVAFFRLGMDNPPMPATTQGKTSIAVLPFTNMTADEENEYFSDGMTEDILTKLSKIDAFAVTSRTSIMQYKSTSKTTKQIARELGVSHILEGSVRRDGDRVRINAQLIDAETDAHIWAHQYDEEITSIFDVQSQVAADIADKLMVELSEEDLRKIGPDRNYSVDAYDLYLKGREHYRKYTAEDNDRAIDLFYEALAIEPEFSYAYAGLGDAYAQKAFRHDMNHEMLDTAVLMSARAVDIDPNLSEGYKALGLAYHYKGSWDTAKTQYIKALELDPSNDMAASNLSMIEKEKGQYAEAAKWANRTLELNKNVPQSAANMAGLYLEVGDDELAEKVVDKGLEVNPDAVELKILKGEVSMREGRMPEAETRAQELVEMMPEKPVGYQLLGNVYLMEQDWAKAAESFRSAEQKSEYEADKITHRALAEFAESKRDGSQWSEEDANEILKSLEKLESEKPYARQTAALIRAGIETQLGEYDQAIEHLEVAVENNWMDYKMGMRHPIFIELKGQPAFEAIMEKIKQRSDSLRIEVETITRNDGT